MFRDEYRFLYKGIFCTFLASLSRIFLFKKKNFENGEILVAGGYGWGNAGDEAQCTQTLKLLRTRYPNLEIVCLTPNIKYTYLHNDNFYCKYASRVMIFNQGRSFDLFSYIEKSKLKLICFFIKFIITWLNCFLVRADLPVLLINSRTASFLYELKEARLLFFCGGGYLTGSTYSRLWDGILMCACAHVLKTDVVMSGETVGNFMSTFNRRLAKWGFAHVKLITTRDRFSSLLDLKEIGLDDPNRFFATHDDALFCEKQDDFFYSSEPYAVVNFMDYRMPDKDALSRRVVEICKNLAHRFRKVVFLPMDNLDVAYFKRLASSYQLKDVELYGNAPAPFRVARAIISGSQICLTMRHHPIVFALGERVPVVSLYCNDYFKHKNIGALSLFDLDKFSVDLRSFDCVDKTMNLVDESLISLQKYKDRIKVKLIELARKKEIFMQKVDKILEDQKL